MIVYVLIGLMAGVLSGLFGIGGGVVLVPALILSKQFSIRLATGTSLAALLLPVGILGVWEYYRHDFVNVSAAAFVAVGLLVGAWCGARLGLWVSARTLQRAFSLFLVLIAVHLWQTS